MVGGFGVTTAMRVVVVLLMALIAIVPFVLVSAAVWLVFFKLSVTVWQFLAVCLLQFLAFSSVYALEIRSAGFGVRCCGETLRCTTRLTHPT